MVSSPILSLIFFAEKQLEAEISPHQEQLYKCLLELELSQLSEAKVYLAWARFNRGQNDYQRALDAAKQALALTDNSASTIELKTLTEIAELYGALGQQDGAQAYMQTAVSSAFVHFPNTERVTETLGRAFELYLDGGNYPWPRRC